MGRRLRCTISAWIALWFFVTFVYEMYYVPDGTEVNYFQPKDKNSIGIPSNSIDYPNLDGDVYFKPHIVDLNETMVYSAYIDLRRGNMGGEASIRFMALARTADEHTTLYCYFFEIGELRNITWYETPEPHGADFAAYVLSCVIPENFTDPVSQVTRVGVCKYVGNLCNTVVIPISNFVADFPNSIDSPVRSPKYEHTVCVPTLYGTRYTERHVIEFIEATTILGADHFFFYVFDRDYERYKKILRYYRSRGRITYFILKLLIDPSYISVWNYAQSLVVQDCLFRNAGFSRYVVFNDIATLEDVMYD